MVFDVHDEQTTEASGEPKVRPLPPEGPEAPRRSPPRSFPLWPVLGALVVGMVLGGLLARSPGSGTVQDESLLTPTLAPEARSRGLAKSVEGFDDVLLVVAPDGVGAMRMLTWPPAGPLQRSSVPASWTAITFDDGPFTEFAAFDASGEQVALASPVAREGSLALLAGAPGGVVVVATGVTSYVWHRSEPRNLAYTVVDSDGTWLEVMRGSPRLVERLAAVEQGAKIVAWADWGYALEEGDRLILVSPATRIETPGRLLATADTEVLIQRDGGAIWKDPLTGSTRATTIAKGALRATVSPSGDLVAVAFNGSLEVFAGDGVVAAADWFNVERLAWSLDDSFVLFSDRTDVMVLDVSRREVTALGLSRGVAVGVRSVDLSFR